MNTAILALYGILVYCIHLMFYRVVLRSQLYNNRCIRYAKKHMFGGRIDSCAQYDNHRTPLPIERELYRDIVMVLMVYEMLY